MEEPGDKPLISLIGPGIIYYPNAYSQWRKGYMLPEVWHLLTRHYQRQDHTPWMLISNLQEKIPTDAIDLMIRAINIVLDITGRSPHEANDG